LHVLKGKEKITSKTTDLTVLLWTPQGVIGDSYNHVSHLPQAEYMTAKTSGLLAVRPTISYPLLPDSSYEIEGYFTSPIRQIMAQLLKRLHLKTPKGVLSQ
jgi:hypothetical protein